VRSAGSAARRCARRAAHARGAAAARQARQAVVGSAGGRKARKARGAAAVAVVCAAAAARGACAGRQVRWRGRERCGSGAQQVEAREGGGNANVNARRRGGRTVERRRNAALQPAASAQTYIKRSKHSSSGDRVVSAPKFTNGGRRAAKRLPRTGDSEQQGEGALFTGYVAGIGRPTTAMPQSRNNPVCNGSVCAAAR